MGMGYSSDGGKTKEEEEYDRDRDRDRVSLNALLSASSCFTTWVSSHSAFFTFIHFALSKGSSTELTWSPIRATAPSKKMIEVS